MIFACRLKRWWLMAAFQLPVLMNRWELFLISASVVYMCKRRPLVCLRAFWKPFIFLILFSIAEALLFAMLSVSSMKNLWRRDHFQPLWNNPSSVEIILTRTFTTFRTNWGSGFAWSRMSLPVQSKKAFPCISELVPSRNPLRPSKTCECGPRFPWLPGRGGADHW